MILVVGATGLLGGAITRNMTPFLASFETFESGIDMSATATVYGIDPTSLSDFVQSFFADRISTG
jgi:hypothetical protein